MGDFNSGDHRALSQSSQTQKQQQPQTAMNTNPLSLDIPSSQLDLDSIIAPSELDSPTPEQWAELDSQF
jgi:hypothetical protein